MKTMQQTQPFVENKVAISYVISFTNDNLKPGNITSHFNSFQDLINRFYFFSYVDWLVVLGVDVRGYKGCFYDWVATINCLGAGELTTKEFTSLYQTHMRPFAARRKRQNHKVNETQPGSKRSWRFRNYYKQFSTINESRAYIDYQDQMAELNLAARNRRSKLANPWDDMPRHIEHGWKANKNRRRQYKVKDVN